MTGIGDRGAASRSRRGPVVLVTSVGAAGGSRAAAAALAGAASESDCAALLVDVEDGSAPRPSLFTTAAARRLEERLAAHLPDAGVASRGQVCRLELAADRDWLGQIAAALPLARESAAVIHLSPQLLRATLEHPSIQPTTALLRADLAKDRALTALAARDLMSQSLRVVVLKRPLGWLAARAALHGGLPPAGAAFPDRLLERLLGADDGERHR